MQSISTYDEALKAIWNRSGYDRGFISDPFAGDDAARLGLLRTQALLVHVGFTTFPYAIVHVAGSKGKGSTSSLIDAMLRAAGYRTGRFLSPHLHSFRERFVVDNTMISESNFIQLTNHFVDAAVALEHEKPEIGRVTAFELNTAMALAWFARQDCQVAVIEVGMGGELDSTNIVTPTVSVITTLDFEHTAILGSTLAEIARNKAGIIKEGRPVLSANQPPEALNVIADRVLGLNAELSVANQHWEVHGSNTGFSYASKDVRYSDLTCSLVGSHQMENAGLAITAVNALGKHEPSLTVNERAIRYGLANTIVPARFELVTMPSGQIIVIDGAHTPASVQALRRAMRENFPDASVALVVGMLADKDQQSVLEPLATIAASWIAVAPNNPRALPVGELRSSIHTLGAAAEIVANVAEGIRLAERTGADVILITGSFSTASEARVALDLAEFVDPPVQI